MEPREPIVIVGTGRSGTSLLAGVLRHLDVFMGYTFVPENETNPYGHYEDVEFIFLNRHVIHKQCSVGAWRRQIEPLIERRRVMGVRWGWKAPCTTDLLCFFTKIVPNATWIHMHRPKDEVVRSCMKAYNYSEEVAGALYDNRLKNIDYYLTNPCHIEFHDIISDPETVVKDLATYLCLDVDPTEAINSIQKRRLYV